MPPVHFGLIPKTPDPRDLTLKGVLKAAGLTSLPPVKPSYGWGHGGTYKNWRMNGNGPVQTGEVLPASWKAAKEGCGDCVNAAAVNELKVALTDAGGTPTAVESKVGNAETAIKLYSVLTGYDPTTGARDEGTEIRARLKYAQKTGILCGDGSRHKIGPYVSFDPLNLEHLLFATKHFEACPIGCSVSEANMEAYDDAWGTEDRIIWSHAASSPIEGLHCIPIVGRPDASHFAALTWMRTIWLTETYRTKQVEEGWAYLSPDRINKVTGKTHEGDPEAALVEYLKAL
jgi:hypothetical protein